MKTISKYLCEHLPGSKRNPELRMKLLEFFRDNKYPDGKQIHHLSENLEIPHKELEKEIYAILTDIFAYGEYNKKKPENIDPEQLKMGTKVEMEHTDCPIIAKRIALDHLAEEGMEKYYSNLINMERAVEQKQKVLNLV